MEAWMALFSIMAIVAVVLVAGGLIAFIVHLIVGALDRKDKPVEYETKNTELLDYSSYKANENLLTQQKDEYDFESINKAKAEEEKTKLEDEEDLKFELDDEVPTEDDEQVEESAEIKPEETEKVEPVEEKLEEDTDELDLDAMLEEISGDIIEEEKEKAVEENAPKMSDELANYNIEDYLKEDEEESAETEIDSEEVADEVVGEEQVEAVETVEETDEEPADEGMEIKPEETEETSVVETVEEPAKPVEDDESKKVIEELKAQLADLNKQLEEARGSKTEVVTINMTEEECVARLEMLENRLKEVKKDYKTNLKEYKPLRKVMNDLEKYQTKLRRKDTIVAKKKVALYGVNNYVDIDKEKAEKLANDLELLEGLRLSVNHCEEVINANKDRYPILERTNQILEDQIAHIEEDIASTQATLDKIREQNGEDENK